MARAELERLQDVIERAPVSFAKSRQGERMRAPMALAPPSLSGRLPERIQPEMLRALKDRCLEERGVSRVWFCLEAASDVLATAVKSVIT